MTVICNVINYFMKVMSSILKKVIHITFVHLDYFQNKLTQKNNKK